MLIETNKLRALAPNKFDAYGNDNGRDADDSIAGSGG